MCLVIIVWVQTVLRSRWGGCDVLTRHQPGTCIQDRRRSGGAVGPDGRQSDKLSQSARGREVIIFLQIFFSERNGGWNRRRGNPLASDSNPGIVK